MQLPENHKKLIPSKKNQLFPVAKISSRKAKKLSIRKIAKRTITKNRFVSVRSHETPRTESDKHCAQNKANV